MLFGLTSLGLVHTAISLVAVGAGLISLVRYKDISMRTGVGKIYIATTVLTCLTAFGIFQHGGFGPPHMLAILTLVALAIAAVAARSTLFGRWSHAVKTVSYSVTFLFHWIPAVTETSTRLPPGAPLLASQDAPELKALTGLLFLLFLIGVTLQLRRPRALSSD